MVRVRRRYGPLDVPLDCALFYNVADAESYLDPRDCESARHVILSRGVLAPSVSGIADPADMLCTPVREDRQEGRPFEDALVSQVRRTHTGRHGNIYRRLR